MTSKIEQHEDLISVCVDSLFGQHNHEINLKPKGMTLIHGPNGVGKTSMLKLIGFALELNVDALANVVFDSMELRFSGGSMLTIKREAFEEESQAEFDFGDPGFSPSLPDFAKELHFEFSKGELKEAWSISSTSQDERKGKRVRLSAIQEARPWLTRVGQDEWLDERTHTIYSTQAILESQVFALSRKDNQRREQLKELLPKIPVETIQSQRLFVTRDRERHGMHRRQEQETVNAVIFHSEKMCELIRNTFHDSANLSQDLDRTFAHRVLTSTGSIDESEGLLRETYENQLGTWQRIRDAGILTEFGGRRDGRMFRFPQGQPVDQQLSLPEELDETQKRVLSFYVKDTKQKLQPYEKLLSKVELFLSIVNSRFDYSGKELVCDPGAGFRVVTRSGRTVPLDSLSSGEQHEVVLNFQLIFSAPENSLILVDEPEISLHVDWQREFIDQVLRIAEVRGHKFIIATHSPQIIDEHWDSTEVLKNSEAFSEENNSE